MEVKRGIYLVANKKSESLCANLVYSIRTSGCTLPIRLIHFGGEKASSPYIQKETEFLTIDDFNAEAKDFIKELKAVLADCPEGYLYRYLGFFNDWDEFIYSDNDIVALMNWEGLFGYLPGNDLVHTDEEYTTQGRFNHTKPGEIIKLFGSDAHERAVTAGHFVARNNKKLVDDLSMAIEWMKQNPGIAKEHDQALLHIALMLGNWKVLNLCKAPHNWLSSWAGDYKNSLDLVHKIQSGKEKVNISHLHYSGFNPKGDRAMEELIFSDMTWKERLYKITERGIKRKFGITYFGHKMHRFRKHFKS